MGWEERITEAVREAYEDGASEDAVFDKVHECIDDIEAEATAANDAESDAAAENDG